MIWQANTPEEKEVVNWRGQAWAKTAVKSKKQFYKIREEAPCLSQQNHAQ